MKKLMLIACVIVGIGCGCSTKNIKVTEHRYVPYGQEVKFAPQSQLGGYMMDVVLSSAMAEQLMPSNTVNKAAFRTQAITGKVTLLVGMTNNAAQ